MKMIDHNHFICHLILGTFTEYPYLYYKLNRHFHAIPKVLTEEKDRKKALKYSKILS